MANDGDDKPDYLGHRQRLRERFLNGGDGALQDYELLELLVAQTQKRIDTKPIAKAHLAHLYRGRPLIGGGGAEPDGGEINSAST